MSLFLVTLEPEADLDLCHSNIISHLNKSIHVYSSNEPGFASKQHNRELSSETRSGTWWQAVNGKHPLKSGSESDTAELFRLL